MPNLPLPTGRFAFARVRASVFVIALSALATACSPFYVIRAGYEEAKILSRRQSIAELVRDTATPAETREKLRLVLRARAFAADSLALDVGDSYTTFSRLDSDTLAMIVSAAHRDRFEAYTWWFPIVGRVPYKGYFSLSKARAAVADLEAKGLDTYLRPTSAFSTLGWFNDPLVSPLLRYDSVSLASTVIHELTHNTLYLPGQAGFNESFAEFVGGRGAVELFCGGEGRGTPECSRATGLWADELIFGGYLSDLVAQLEALYADSSIALPEKLRTREEIFRRSQQVFSDSVRPRFQVANYASFGRDPLNNATLISRRLYYQRLDLFDALYTRAGRGSLRRTIQLVLDATEDSEDPFGAVERIVNGE